MRIVFLFVSFILLTYSANFTVYSQTAEDSNSAVSSINESTATIDLLARQKGEVVVIWVKNLDSSETIDTVELTLVRAKIESFSISSTWNALLDNGGARIKFQTQEPLGLGKTLRLKIITDSTLLNFAWHAFANDAELASGFVKAEVLFKSKAIEQFPAHDYSYRNGKLINLVTGQSLEVFTWVDINMSKKYPLLSVKDGFEIKRATFGTQREDLSAFVVAKHIHKDTGLVIQNMNWTQGAFIFVPLDSPDRALQYLQFMYHETHSSFTGREYREITSVAEYNESTEKMEKKAKSFGSELEFLRDPPTKITKVQQIDSAYKVERVFLKLSERERIIYSNSLVHPSGIVEVKEQYVFVQGATGFLL